MTSGFPYFLYRRDRTQRKGGGVFCMVRSFLDCTEVKLNTNMAPDILCCDILIHVAASPLRIISVYRPPNTKPADDHYWIISLILAHSVNYNSLNSYFLSVDWLTLFDNFTSASDVYKRFCKQLYMTFSHFVEFKAPQMTRTVYPIHIRNLAAQKERLSLSLDRPLEDDLYRKVCRDLDGHVKKFLANREHRLTRGSNLKRLFHYIRQKSRDNLGLPTLFDASGKKYISDTQKARILGEYFASVFCTGSEQSVPDVRGIPHVESGLSGIFFHPEDVRKMLESIKPSTFVTASLTDSQSGVLRKRFIACFALLNIYTSLSYIATSPDVKVQMYADDIKIYAALTILPTSKEVQAVI
ncbi:hypothetical protein COOONC_15300 [Cooperia oncophora]